MKFFHIYLAMSEVEPPKTPLRGTCGSMCLQLKSLKQPAATLFYWNSHIDQSEGLFRGLSSNNAYMALSAVEPPYIPIYAYIYTYIYLYIPIYTYIYTYICKKNHIFCIQIVYL